MRRSVTEALRLYPPLILLMRKVMHHGFEVGQHTIPKGDVVGLCAPASNLDPRYWHDATEFKPSRFASGSDEAVTFNSRSVGHGKDANFRPSCSVRRRRAHVLGPPLRLPAGVDDLDDPPPRLRDGDDDAGAEAGVQRHGGGARRPHHHAVQAQAEGRPPPARGGGGGRRRGGGGGEGEGGGGGEGEGGGGAAEAAKARVAVLASKVAAAEAAAAKAAAEAAAAREEVAAAKEAEGAPPRRRRPRRRRRRHEENRSGGGERVIGARSKTEAMSKRVTAVAPATPRTASSPPARPAAALGTCIAPRTPARRAAASRCSVRVQQAAPVTSYVCNADYDAPATSREGNGRRASS